MTLRTCPDAGTTPALPRRALLRIAGTWPMWATGIAQAGMAALDWAPQTLVLAWRRPDGRDEIGRVRLDWEAGRMEIQQDWLLPSRAHGLSADGRGGFNAVSARAGDWLLHVDAEGQARWHRQQGPWTFNGHLLLHPVGLFATETDPRADRAWLALHDPDTLALRARWALDGRDAHQLVSEPDGSLLLALGGLPRSADGRKRAGPIESALLRVDPADGRERRRWTLADPQMSLRHLAWSIDGRRLGVALQAEHELAAKRLDAPLLAVLEDERLQIPAVGGPGLGYAGDLCAAPGGGFVLSAQKAGLGLLWHPDAPAHWTRIAELTELCALAPCQTAGGLAALIVGGRGVARWQASGARMLAWPKTLAPDNHMALLD